MLQINPKFSDFKDFILNIQKYFDQSTKTIHKARNELKIIKHNGIDVVVKSFKVPNIINQIVYSFFRNSKAKKSYLNGMKLINLNINTPKPIGYIEFYKFGLLKQSYFISERFNYDFTIRKPLLDDNFKDKTDILKAFAKFTFELHQNNILHQDYSPGNILIKKEDNNYIFKIVDINRMKFKDLSLEDRAKSFSKLWASDDELTNIAKEYTKHYQCDSQYFIKQICYYSNKNKQIKNLKKRLKGEIVND